MNEEQTRECPICHRPYVIYPHYVGDQTACPMCRGIARKKMPNPFDVWYPYKGG